MKRILIILSVCCIAGILLSSCATKIPFEQTCLTCVQSQRLNCKGSDCPSTVMVGGNCLAIFDETGEKVNMNHILTEEGIARSKDIPVTLAKVRGRYFVTGNGFKNLWILIPNENEAKIKSVIFPEEITLTAGSPVFEIVDGNLLVRTPDSKISCTWDIDNQKWIINTTKAGA